MSSKLYSETLSQKTRAEYVVQWYSACGQGPGFETYHCKKKKNPLSLFSFSLCPYIYGILVFENGP
jgi:hypothetical protein